MSEAKCSNVWIKPLASRLDKGLFLEGGLKQNELINVVQESTE